MIQRIFKEARRPLEKAGSHKGQKAVPVDVCNQQLAHHKKEGVAEEYARVTTIGKEFGGGYLLVLRRKTMLLSYFCAKKKRF